MNNRAYYQKGIAIPIIVISLLTLFGFAGLALDMSNHYLTKTLIQNALDASALSGAKVLNDTGDIVQAETAAQTVFNFHLTGKLEGEAITPTFEFSDTLIPFNDGGIEPKFIRASVSDYNLRYYFAQALPGVGNTQKVVGTAVSGPSPSIGQEDGNEVCGIAPLLICADHDEDGDVDADCSDGECWGYEVKAKKATLMKTGSGSDWEVGSGNFQLLAMECGTGGNCLAKELAGESDNCLTIGETATTEPGNKVGPTNSGFNSRFNMFDGGPGQLNPYDHPPDTVTYFDTSYDPNDGGEYTEAAATATNDFWYQDYQIAQLGGGVGIDVVPKTEGGTGVPGRRILTVPVGDCRPTINGRGEVPIYSTACVFMIQPASHSGNTQYLHNQFIGDCKAAGDIAEFPEGPGVGFGVYKIILYKDPDNIAS